MKTIALPRMCSRLAPLLFVLLQAPLTWAQDVTHGLPPWWYAIVLSEPAEEEETLDEFALAMLEATNAVRAGVQPAASPPLAPMSWDADAAQVAQAWADNCQWNHNSQRSSQYNALTGGSAYVGENIYARSSIMPPAEIATLSVNAWASEVADYNYADNSCDPGKVCGHYTQLVWRNSTAVGCAVASCPGMLWSTTQFLVCNYVPGGNYVGQHPY